MIAENWLMKTREAAEFLGTHPVTLRVWRSKGQGPPFIRLEGHVRYQMSDLEKYLRSRKISPGTSEKTEKGSEEEAK